MVNKTKAEKGQKVKVVDCLHGHEFPIGTVVICVSQEIGSSCEFEYLSGSDYWWMEPEEYEIIE